MQLGSGMSIRAFLAPFVATMLLSCGGSSGDGGGGGQEPVDCVVSAFSDWTGGAWSRA